MRRRKVLVIHHSPTIQKVIKRYLLSELTDIDLTEAQRAEDGNELIHEKAFDVIICGKEIKEIDGLELFERARASSVNGKAPFVLITSDSRLESLERIRANGVKHVLVIPFSARALGEKVQTLCNPRRWRKYDRVCMMGLHASFHVNGGDLLGEVVNVSCGGLLCDLEATDRVYELLKNPDICLHIPTEYGGGVLEAESQFVRLSVLDWKTPHKPSRYRTAWSFRHIDGESFNQLQEAIDRAQSTMKLSVSQGG